MKDLKNLWFYIFLGVSVFFSTHVDDFFANEPNQKVIFSAILGGCGAAIGLLVYLIVKNKSNIVKTFGLLGLLAFFGGTFYCFYRMNELRTCEICGYKAIEKNNIECLNCGTETWEKTNKANYKDKNEWIKLEQLDWF